MTPDFDNVVGGPACVKIGDVAQGHTAGGISIKVTPNNRPVLVDQFGTGECNVRHQGDVVRATIPFAEWIAGTFTTIYNPGRDVTTGGSTGRYLGIGRSAGYIYTTADLKLVPFLTADAAKLVQFYRATPIGDFEFKFNDKDDRIFQVDYACLVDETKTDGELTGKIFLN